MLFNSQRLLRRLRKKGRQATAEVIWIKTIREGKSMRALWAPDEDLNRNWVDCLLRLRVVPPDGGAAFEATVTTRISPLRELGATVPVWYDPRDPGKIAMDPDLAADHQKIEAG